MSNTPGALIAMSGGVDSTVAAYLMKQAGCRCMGATMRLYQNEDLGQSGFHTCCSAKDVEDAAEVAFQLDIPFEVVNYTEEFREKVIAKFIETYEAGGTPNPCIDCNRTMKFDKMLDFAREHGLDYVVTGHYARIEQDPATGRWLLKKALYTDKDQSYVLYVLNQDQLAHTKFPLGGMDKPSIRKIAEERSEYNRLKELADQQKAAIEEKVEAARRRMENGTAFLTSCLADFFNTVPHKTTKTTEKYRLLSGTLTLKKGTVKATVDDSKLVPWLRENGYGDLVKVEESAKWGELKKLLAYTGEIATIQSTGEIVEGVTAYETPATFTVDI